MAKLWAEAWSRPGDAAYGRKIADLPIASLGGTQGYSGVYPANAAIQKNYTRLNEILYTDGVTPSNGTWSTIRVFAEGVADPVYEFLPDYLVPSQSKADTTVTVSGLSMEALMGFARVEPWDWDGSPSFISTFPDWVYGGQNLLSNPGFETSTCRPEVNEIVLDPTVTGGTFTLSDGTDTTSAIAWNASAFTIESEIESDIIAADDVNVTGAGTEADPWVIEFVSPCEFPGGLTPNFASLTPAPGTSELVRTQIGSLQPNPWTKSQVVSSGTPRIFGEYTNFKVSDVEAHTGTYSLLINPAAIGRRFAGAQQILNVEPGGLYQASVWVFASAASQEYRLVIRGIDEDLLQTQTGNATAVVVPAANTWTQVSIPNVLVGDNTQIIFRFANINVSGNPATFYVDDGSFTPGLPPATVGKMLEDLYADATTDHVGRMVWEDEAVSAPYLSLDFTDALDSDGVAWDRSDVALTFRPRMSYVQVLDTIANEGGYEWRIVPGLDGMGFPDKGYYLLQLFNPGTLGGTVAAGIQGGSSDISHNARYFAPNASDVVVQGAAQLSSRTSTPGLLSAFGRIEGSDLDLNITSLTSAAAAASESAASGVRGAEALVYTLRGVAQQPLVLYRAGDTIRIEDPPIVSGSRRVSTIEFSIDATGVEYTVSMGSEALIGQTAVNHQVGVLLKRFQRADELPDPQGVNISGGGGAPTVVLSTTLSTSMSQSKADFVCDGFNDAANLQAALDICLNYGGRILFTEGIFDFGFTEFVIPDTNDPIYFEGAGKRASILQWTDVTALDIITIKQGGFRNIQLRQTPGG